MGLYADATKEKRPMKKYILLAIAIVVILSMFSLFSLFYFQMGLNEIILSSPSPNGEYVAYVFTRSAGATTRESYQLSILRKGRELGNSGGNTYVSYAEFSIEWIGNKELFVQNGEEGTRGDIFTQKISVSGVNVTYERMKSQ